MVVADEAYGVKADLVSSNRSLLGHPLDLAGEGWGAGGCERLDAHQLRNVVHAVDVRSHFPVSQKELLSHAQKDEEHVVRNLSLIFGLNDNKFNR